MARLNEPVVPIETIDSLKRKFMRQNRDIARVNSTQSIRIRNLENEVSALVAENLSLREQVSHYRLQVESSRAQHIAQQTVELKAQLEQKLEEISSLIGGLGFAPVRKSPPERGRISLSNNVQSPKSRGFRNEADAEGRLPPILENKLYPRKTLEYWHDKLSSEQVSLTNDRRQEILDITEAQPDSTDSPEIGPPPVSQFVDEGPVKIDLPRRARPHASPEEGTHIDPTLSINLEQRRRRKDSGGNSETRRSSRSEPVIEEKDVSDALKIGSKRKLSVREDDDVKDHVDRSAGSSDEFVFTRVAAQEKRKGSEEKIVSKGVTDPTASREGSKDQQIALNVPSSRKVLAPKSVNNSPRKVNKSLVTGDAKPHKPEAPKPNTTRERRENTILEPVQIAPTTVTQLPEEILFQEEPEFEVPATLDLISPTTALEAVSSGLGSRDTPPPSDLGLGNEAQRPSRRARGSVSYAEPNLRDKMRRPTKELVDAVGRDGKGQRNSSAKLEESETQIKVESDSSDWKTVLPATTTHVESYPPASQTAVSDTLPSSITTHRKRRESLLQQNSLDDNSFLLTSSSSGLFVENKKSQAQRGENTTDTRVTFESDGSKRTLSGHQIVNRDIREKVASSKRRQSAMPLGSAAPEDSDVSDVEATRKTRIIPQPRRQSTLGLKSSSSASEIPNRDVGNDRSLKRSSSNTAIVGERPDSRNDRISARRRSTML